MSKYIDAERLIAEIERRIEETKSMKPSFDQFWAGQISAFKGVENIITSLQQEQPDIDLAKFTEKIDSFTERYKNNLECMSIKGAMAFMARMFYQYPEAAREWYENLPKAIMD